MVRRGDVKRREDMAKVLVDKDFLEGGLELICDSIRLKTGGTGVLAFPVEIASAVESIETGGGGITPTGDKLIEENGEEIDVASFATVTVAVPVGTDTSDATASAADIRAGQTAYVNGAKVTGSAAEQPATTWTPTTSDQTIASGKILTGAQTIKGDADLVAGNIKKNVQIFGVTGSYEGTNTSDATAAAGDIRTGKTAYVNGQRVTGTLPGLGASTHTPTTTDQVIPSGFVLTGNQTIKGDARLVPGNIKKDVQIFGVTGSYEGSGSGSAGAGTSYVLASRTNTYHLEFSGLTVPSGAKLEGVILSKYLQDGYDVNDGTIITLVILGQNANTVAFFTSSMSSSDFLLNTDTRSAVTLTINQDGTSGSIGVDTSKVPDFGAGRYRVFPIWVS